ncbi:MAG: DUF488 domain-containing protein [Ectothiorhodospiraceae bacterium]
MRALYTIGYEGSSTATFLAALADAGVTQLVDVRQAPVSRKPGFARRALTQALGEAGIGYRHEGALGAPKPLRDQVRRDGDYATFFSAYRAHLAEQWSRLEALAREADDRIALMCYERDVATCHRYAVAEALAAIRGVEPTHLVPARAE